MRVGVGEVIRSLVTNSLSTVVHINSMAKDLLFKHNQINVVLQPVGH